MKIVPILLLLITIKALNAATLSRRTEFKKPAPARQLCINIQEIPSPDKMADNELNEESTSAEEETDENNLGSALPPSKRSKSSKKTKKDDDDNEGDDVKATRRFSSNFGGNPYKFPLISADRPYVRKLNRGSGHYYMPPPPPPPPPNYSNYDNVGGAVQRGYGNVNMQGPESGVDFRLDSIVRKYLRENYDNYDSVGGAVQSGYGNLNMKGPESSADSRLDNIVRKYLSENYKR